MRAFCSGAESFSNRVMIFNNSLERIQATPFKIELATGSVMYKHYNRFCDFVTILLFSIAKDLSLNQICHGRNLK
jgi:hypothetical protein